VVLANYVFDSLPIDLLRVRLRHGACTVPVSTLSFHNPATKSSCTSPY
jgi:hypothetical protein